jgi:hypothetical protein
VSSVSRSSFLRSVDCAEAVSAGRPERALDWAVALCTTRSSGSRRSTPISAAALGLAGPCRTAAAAPPLRALVAGAVVMSDCAATGLIPKQLVCLEFNKTSQQLCFHYYLIINNLGPVS